MKRGAPVMLDLEVGRRPGTFVREVRVTVPVLDAYTQSGERCVVHRLAVVRVDGEYRRVAIERVRPHAITEVLS